MADAKQDKNKDKKEVSSEGSGFKTVMGGFDKNEVNLYIAKLRKQMKEQSEEYERRLSNLQTNLEDAHKEAAQAKSEKKTAEQAAATASAPIIKDSSAETKKLIDNLKAESDKKIMELRKSILDERRNVAKFDKECAMAKMSEKKVREEYDKLKEKYLTLKKKGGGTTVVKQKAVTTTNADEVMAEASAYAKEIIAAAKAYAADAVKATEKYKADVEAELKERSDKLSEVKSRLDAQIKKTEADQADSAKRVREVTEKIGAITSLFDSFASQFNSVNSQISGVTSNIDSICRQFNETTGQIGNVAKQISETTSQIDTVSRQINETTSQIDSVSKEINEATSQIDSVSREINEATTQINTVSKQINETSERINGFAKSINDTTGKINDASKKMNDTTDMISEASKKMNETSGLIGDAAKKLDGFGDTLNSAKTDIDGITKLVDDTKSSIDGAKSSVSAAQSAASAQAAAADLSPIGKIGEEIALAAGSLRAKLELPKFDESRFSDSRFEAIKNKLRIETTYEDDGTENVTSAAVDDDDDEFEESDIISSMEIESPDTELPSDDDLMADVPDVITAPVFEETKPEPKPEPAVRKAPEKPDNSAKTERPGLDSDFEDFFLTEPKDDDMSGDIPLINMEGVGVVDDFSLDAAPEPIGQDFDIAPIDKTAKPEKGADLGADIFDIAIDPAGVEDDTLANMMSEANAAEKAANIDLTPTDLNFDEDNTLPSNAADDFGEFADLFAAGSSQTSTETSKNSKPAFKNNSSGDDWGFGSDPGVDSDLSDLLI